jgi:hypothetical protein
MDAKTTQDIAAALYHGLLYEHWWFYVLLLALPALGGLFGALFGEFIKAAISRRTWLAQESWKEKYRIYLDLFSHVDTVFHAANNVAGDVKTIGDQHGKHMGLQEWERLHPEHAEMLREITERMSKVIELDPQIGLLLPAASASSLEPVRKAYFRAGHVINMNVAARISGIALGAGESKVALVAAAKKDLQV